MRSRKYIFNEWRISFRNYLCAGHRVKRREALRRHRNEIRAQVRYRWFIPSARRKIYYSRALSAPRLFFNRATESRGREGEGREESPHPSRSHARLKPRLCVNPLFLTHCEKVEKARNILRFYEKFCVIFRSGIWVMWTMRFSLTTLHYSCFMRGA